MKSQVKKLKHQIVTLTKNNARIHRVADASKYVGLSDVVIDPDLSLLAGVPPHYWKIENGNLAEMTEEEKQARELDIKSNPVENKYLLEREIIKEVEKPVYIHHEIMRIKTVYKVNYVQASIIGIIGILTGFLLSLIDLN